MILTDNETKVDLLNNEAIASTIIELLRARPDLCWGKKPEVQAAFPVVKSVLDGAGSKESKHAVKLTSQGWEAKGLDC